MPNQSKLHPMKKTLLHLSILLVLTASMPTKSSAQVELQDGLTVETLVNTFFNSGVLVSISNITFNGAPASEINNQLALFGNGLSDSLGMDAGLAMGTNPVQTALLGNWIDPGNPGFDGDPDITVLAGMNTTTCAVLEFDVLVEADALAFNYVFGSTEYEGFTCSVFNDAFGFFISGPGITGPFSNNAINIATIPDSETPIAINTVNGGMPSGGNSGMNCQNANPNWQEDVIYFVNNSQNAASSIVSSGYTVNLEAYVEVINGETYHMKLAICNAADGALPSVVLFEEGSFEGRMLSAASDVRKNELQLFPNPAVEMLYVEGAYFDMRDDLRITISDIQGREVAIHRPNASGRIELPVSSLEKGIYIVNMYSGNEFVAVSKFVKK